jgi:hypothetical protein
MDGVGERKVDAQEYKKRMSALVLRGPWREKKRKAFRRLATADLIYGLGLGSFAAQEEGIGSFV